MIGAGKSRLGETTAIATTNLAVPVRAAWLATLLLLAVSGLAWGMPGDLDGDTDVDVDDLALILADSGTTVPPGDPDKDLNADGVISALDARFAAAFLCTRALCATGNNPPSIADQTLSVDENSPNATAVGSIVASDPDLPPDGITFAITAGNTNGAFALDANTGALTVANVAELDFETTPQFNLTVEVTDDGLPAMTASATVTVDVNDVPENPTITNPAAVNAAENQTAVVDVDSADPGGETEGGGGLTYSLTGGADQALFSIDVNTGVLAFLAAPDFDIAGDANTDNVYEVEVTVTNTTPLAGSQTFQVTVTNVNEAPEITSDGGGANAAVNSAENQTAVTDAQSTDPDGTVEGAGGLTYSLTGGADQALFGIVATTGVLTFNTAPDFEIPADAGANNVYDVQVTVTDPGGLTDVQDIAVTVTDANDAPVITSDGGGPTAAVNAPENQTSVTTVTATDADLPAQILTFSITGGADSALFGIVAATGVLTFNAAPDFEAPADAGANNVYDVQVTVTDNGTPNFTDVQDIAVTVAGANEEPEITSDGGAATAAVNAAENQTAVTTVTATDPDLPAQTLTFSITGGADMALFGIGAASGVLTFNAAPDFEIPGDAGANNVYDVQVTVTDSGAPNLTDVQDIAVTVTDVNDAPVVTSDGGGATAAVNAAENQTAVTTVTATDADMPAQTLTFSITGGADAGLFGIVGATGVLTFSAAPDFEAPADAGTDNVYDVQVTVTDDGAPNLSDVQDIAVTVTGVNEAPEITSDGGGPTAALNAAENQTAATTVTATDTDVPAQTLAFSITGGADMAQFGIGAASGVLTFNAAPDFEAPGDVGGNNVYDVQVTVTDSGAANLTDVQDIAATVTDVNDAPVITSDGGGPTAGVNAEENQTAVTTVTATDADLPAQTLNFSITGGADSGLFGIGAASGVLTFNAAPDFEAPGDAGANNVYDVQVTVNDNGAPSQSDMQDIAVTVTQANDAPEITSDGGGPTAAVNAGENQTAATTVTATDVDLPAQTLTFSITGGADMGLFGIGAVTGILTFNAAPDFEIPGDAGGNNVYDVQVTVTDSGAPNLADVQDIAVTVTDVNDSPAITSNGGGPTAAVNAAENQTAVTTVTANDADLPAQTLTFSITGGADMLLFGIVPATGALSFLAAPDREAPADSGGNNVYDVQVAVTDNGAPNLSDVQDIAVTVTNVNEAPTITSSATANAAENQTVAVDVQSADPDGESEGGGGLTYSVTGGADQAWFSIDSNTGALTFSVAPDFENPVDADNNNVYLVEITVTDVGLLSGMQTITVTVTSVNEAPRLVAGKLKFIEVQLDGAVPVDGLDGASSVATSPDGLHLYATGVADSAVAVFSRNAATGALTFVEQQKDGVGLIDGLAGASSVTVSPDGKHVLATGSIDNAVAVFSRNSGTGALTFVEQQKDGVGLVDGLAGASSVTVSPDGKHVYAAGDTDDAVAVFSRNTATGALTFVEQQKDGVGLVDGLAGASSVTVSSDGKHMYATGATDGAVAVFSRNAITGALTFVEQQKDGVGPVDGLAGASSVTVSAGGAHVYATGATDHAVAVFSRNATTGALTFVEQQKDGVGPVDGLAGASSVTVSSDGAHVYATGTVDDAIAVFSRNPATGALTFLEQQKDGVGTVNGLDEASSVTVTRDGRHLYATGRLDDALAVFSRQDRTVQFIAPTPIAILNSNTDFSVTDIDSATLVSATVTITNLLDDPDEILAATASGVILAGDIVYTPATGILTITPGGGSAPLADFEAVLRSVTYDNDKTPTPTATTRLITAVVNDGAAVGPLDSNTFTVMVTLNTAPTAVDDVYNMLPVNVLLDAGSTQTAFIDVDDADGVLSKGTDDSDPEGDALSVTMVNATAVPGGGSASITTAGGGSLSMSSDGTFDYVSAVGTALTTDTFIYEVSDTGGLTDTGTVTINFTGEVWFIDNSASGGGNDGRSNSPFETIGAFNTANGGGAGMPAAGDTVFLRTGTSPGTPYATTLGLLGTQNLNGENEALTVGALTTVASTAPSLAPAAGNGIDLASGNTIRGLDIGNTPAGHAFSGTAVGTLTISNVDVSGTGGLLEVTTSGNLDNVSFTSSMSTSTAAASGDPAIVLSGITGGTVNLGSPDIDGTDGAGVSISSSSASFTFGSVTIDGTGGNGVDILGTNSGTITFGAGSSIGGTTTTAGTAFNVNGGSANVTYSGNITNTAGLLINVQNTTGSTVQFNGASLSDSGTGANTGMGITIGNTAGNVTIGATATTLTASDLGGLSVFGAITGTVGVNNATITDPATDPGINIDGDNGGVDQITGTIDLNNVDVTTSNVAPVVSITGLNTGGSVDFDASSAIGSTGGGIAIGSLAAGIIDFNGPVTLDVTSPVAFGATNNGTATVNFDGGLDIDTTAGTTAIAAFLATGGGTFNVTNSATETIDNSNGKALQLDGVTVGMTLDSVSSASSLSQGIQLDNISGTLTINGGSITGATGTAYDVGGNTNGSGGNATVVYAGSITNEAGRAVLIQELAGGSHTLSGEINHGMLMPVAAEGIQVSGINNGTAASVTFSGATSIKTTGANIGIDLNTNTNGTISFTGGGLDIDTITGNGFSATGGAAAINVTGTGNTIASTTGTALNVNGSTIGASGMTFQSISAGTGAGSAGTGILLDTTGTDGGLTVTGTGAAGTGGTIRNKTGVNGSTDGIGISLSSTQDVSLTSMQLNDFQNFAIRGTGVANFTLASSTVTATGAAFNGNSAAADEGSISFDNLTGTALFSNNTIERGHEDNIVVTNTAMGSALNRMTVTGGTIGLNNLNDGILVEAQSNATLNLTVAGVSFLGSDGDHIQVNALGTSNMDVIVQDNTFANAHPSPLGSGVTISGGSAGSSETVTYNVSGTTVNSQSFNGAVASAITVGPVNGSGSYTGTVQNNKIGTSGVAGSGSSAGGAGVAAQAGGGSTHTVLIDRNDIDRINGTNGVIDLNTQISGTLNATITNNTVNELEGFTFAGVYMLTGGANVTDTAHICADVRNNTIDATVSFGFDIAVDQLGGSTSTYNFPGYPGPMTPAGALATFLDGQNTLAQSPFGVDDFSAANVSGAGATCP